MTTAPATKSANEFNPPKPPDAERVIPGDELEPYRYESLSDHPDTLRLLRLHSAKDEYEEVDAQLIRVSLEDNISYEAVSWFWGRGPADQTLRIHDGDTAKAFPVSQNLKSALRAMRKNNVVRLLWIDAICINQHDIQERNEQVPKMDRIYGNAQNVCIWLGEADKESSVAIRFIKDIVGNLWRFDKLIEDRDQGQKWKALATLMKRPWFSRRWVVQELALSPNGGTVYCGKDEVSWQDFADAVSLFVQVETATHSVSEVMKRDLLFNHIPDFFGDVSSLGAALLVEATSNLFRNSSEIEEKSSEEAEGKQKQKPEEKPEDKQATKIKRKPLATLETLVSRLTVFEASQPRDTIYALLAIARDTVPNNKQESLPQTPKSESKLEQGSGQKLNQIIKALSSSQKFEVQPYVVNYRLDVIDVYQEFIKFSIHKADQVRALDIICRPWAPAVRKSHDTQEHKDHPSESVWKSEIEDPEVPLPSWIPQISGAAFEIEEHPFVGLRMERQNADSLVGIPESGQKNYSAAEARVVNLNKLRFQKWTTLEKKTGAYYPEYSMFVEGFILDEVESVEQIASNGNMPFSWLGPGGWHDTNKPPPEEFWRLLVADRGPNGTNPPTYFPRACMESLKFKAKTKSKTRGNLDSRVLINEGRSTIVAEFLRRVQAVIWNRLLMKDKSGRLGLVRSDVRPGDKICILYGCSVPVILREYNKETEEHGKKNMEEEKSINWKTWLEKRERVVKFFQDLWRYKVKRRNEKKEAAKMKAKILLLDFWRYSNIRKILRQEQQEWKEDIRKEAKEDWKEEYETRPNAIREMPTPKDASQALEWLNKNSRRSSLPTLPPMPLEDLGTRDIAAWKPYEKFKVQDLVNRLNKPSKLNGLPNGDAKLDQRGERTYSRTEPHDGARVENKLVPRETPYQIIIPKLPQLIRELREKKVPAAEPVTTPQRPAEKPIEPSRKAASEAAHEFQEQRAKRKKKEEEDKRDKVKKKGEQENREREEMEKKMAMPSPIYYKLLGECYVSGMMNGEAISLQNHNTVKAEPSMKPQTFELR